MLALLSFYFRLDGRIDRPTYLRHGAALMLLKYGVDLAAVWLTTGRLWSPLDYVQPLFSARQQSLGPSPSWLLFGLGVWALPFVWIGVSMTLRRLLDAGLAPWLCLLFFVPIANWALMIGLSLRGSLAPARESIAHARDERRVQSALLGVAAGVAIGALSLGLHVVLQRSYSGAVFLGTPFVMGGAAGFFSNRGHSAADTGTARLGALTVCAGAGLTLLFALEGVICLAMALPLAVPLGMLGARVGAAMAIQKRAASPGSLLGLLILPLWGALPLDTALREVTTSIVIDATPAQVWPHVLGFADLEEPPDFLLRMGIAYPVRARLSGQGVGAIRRCEFSTGPFIEPITAWDEPRRLAFDVASQPPPMTEWSPYRHVHPPHLDGTMVSRRGEFRLIPLPGGRTRLEGSTFYELKMDPQLYWSFWSDVLVHRIHQRVLAQIAKESVAR